MQVLRSDSFGRSIANATISHLNAVVVAAAAVAVGRRHRGVTTEHFASFLIGQLDRNVSLSAIE